MPNLRPFLRFTTDSIRLVLTGNQVYWAWLAFLAALIASGLLAYWSQMQTGLIVTAMRDQVSWVDDIKLEFKSWAAANLLQGTRQQALLRICLAFFFITLLKNIACYLQETLMAYVGHAVIRDLLIRVCQIGQLQPLTFLGRAAIRVQQSLA